MSWSSEYEDVDPWPDEREELIEIAWDSVKASTDHAMLVVIDGNEIWLPKSQMHNVQRAKGRFSNAGSCEIPLWLAEEKDLC